MNVANDGVTRRRLREQIQHPMFLRGLAGMLLITIAAGTLAGASIRLVAFFCVLNSALMAALMVWMLPAPQPGTEDLVRRNGSIFIGMTSLLLLGAIGNRMFGS